MPSLTVRSFAEMIHLPMYAQYRILHEQKYPNDEPSAFKIPFYKPSIEIIKQYYQNNNDKSIITNWLQYSAPLLRPESKRINNIRVATTFLKSQQSRRHFEIQKRRDTIIAYPKQDVALKLYFDIEAVENNNRIYQFYNVRNTPIDENIAKDTLFLAYWIMEQNDYSCSIQQLEFIDFVGDNIYKVSRKSKKAIINMYNNATIIEAIWNSI
jgi:hypothetical protein